MLRARFLPTIKIFSFSWLPLACLVLLGLACLELGWLGLDMLGLA